MTTRDQLEAYLAGARQRLQWILSAQGAVALVAALLLATLLAGVALWYFAFTEGAAWTGRAALLLAVAGVAAWFAWRWRALRAAAALERALPAQGGRVATYLQENARPVGASPLIDLLAEDALKLADSEPLATTIPSKRIWVPAAGALAALALFAGVFALRGPVGEGARQLWLGRVPPAVSVAAAAGGIAVKPGDATVRRNQDLAIGALVARGDEVKLHVRFDNGGEWETASMEPDGKGGFAFTLFAVRDAAHYYVSSGPLKSAEHRISVVDVPTIEKLRLTYDYPGWTGLPTRLEEGGGDIRAVAGTRVAVEVVASSPLPGPLLIVNGSDSDLAQSGATSRGNIAVKQAGHYRIATRFGDEVVALTPDFAIELVPDEKPDVKIQRPGKDYRATAIEEVPVRVQARDDFRLESLELKYSVNGGEWRSERLPAGSPDVQAAALLRLEEMQRRGSGGESPLLVPGDLVSYYIEARDHSHSVQTELFLVQVQPFEQRYTQSQAGGGGGGGGGEEDDGDISKRQREVLLATWNLQRTQDGSGAREAERAADNARMLADVQTTLAGQASSLVARAKARMLTGQDQAITQFVKSLEDATKEMEPAAKNLNGMKLTDAIQHEQLALQHLLRAESVFRDIQVAMRSNGGGGGGGGQAGRDVSEMTELEMDLAKNQYETEREMTSQQRNQAEDEALRRLRELARRQEQLARDAARQNQPEQSRWQQEQLRRELEQMRQQLEQLAQQQSQRGSQQQGNSSSQSGAQSGSQSGSQQGSSQQQGAAAEAARQVAQAVEQMRQGDRQGAARASEQLNRAREQLERGRQQAERERFSNLANEAADIAARQRESERELRAAIGNRAPPGIANRDREPSSGMSYEQMDRMAGTKRELQNDLEELQRRMDSTRSQAAEQNPRATGQIAEARKELQDMDTVGSLGRSARDIERGRGVQAATREALISDTLERLQQQLASAADTAAGESGQRRQGREADANDLLAELGDLRRALDRARQQALAQNRSGGGDPGANSPDAREGQAGQDGGQQGQQGQGGQGQQGQGGSSPGQQGGMTAGANGGDGNFGFAGGIGADRYSGGDGRFLGGLRGSPAPVPQGGQALRSQTRLSAERLAQLREALANGTLNPADTRVMQELERRLQRGGADPLSAEYQHMTALVNQLELAALQAQQAKDAANPTRAGQTVDDSRRYRDNVAEYYRRLGGGND
jgi:hypothetical protein